MNTTDFDEGTTKQRPKDSLSRNTLKKYFDDHLFSDGLKHSPRNTLHCKNMKQSTSGEKNSETLNSSIQNQVIDSGCKLMRNDEKLNLTGILSKQ